jgi:hypothetical protein
LIDAYLTEEELFELDILEQMSNSNGRPAPSNWRDWLPALFPSYFSAKFANRHIEFWEWLTAVELGIKPRPFVAIWGRGGAKSTNSAKQRPYGLERTIQGAICGTYQRRKIRPMSM